MAHITLQLVWYRLTEAGSNLAEALDDLVDWYRDFNIGDVDIINLMFVGWILFAVIMVACVSLYKKYKPPADKRSVTTGLPSHQAGEGGSKWVNSVVNWLYLHYNDTPQFVDGWLQGLNDQCRNSTVGKGLCVNFRELAPGSLPPKVTEVHTEAGPRDSLTISATVDSRELGFIATVTSSDSFVTQCEISIVKLNGELTFNVSSRSDELLIKAKFEKRPGIHVTVNPLKAADVTIDVTEVGNIVRDAISNTVVTFNLWPKSELNRQPSFDVAAPPKPPRIQDKRLIVKVLKANGLGTKEFGCCDAYCVLSVENSTQKYMTSVARNTNNPFWDEQFLIDISQTTQQVHVEVLDRERQAGEDSLGRAYFDMARIQSQSLTRHIVSLSIGGREVGSLTIETLLLDSTDGSFVEPDSVAPNEEQLSPRRRIETSHQLTPGGALITETKTITEKLLDKRFDPKTHESPQKIEKTYSTPNCVSENGIENESVLVNGGETVTEAAIQHLMKRPVAKTPAKTSTVVITSVRKTPEMSSELEMPLTPDSVASSHSDKKHQTLGSKIKRRFNKLRRPRSHSVEPRHGDPVSAENLLKPPEEGYRTKSENLDRSSMSSQQASPNLSKSRSRLGSFRQLFRGKKRKDKGDISEGPSRDNSLSRAATQSPDVSRITPEGASLPAAMTSSPPHLPEHTQVQLQAVNGES